MSQWNGRYGSYTVSCRVGLARRCSSPAHFWLVGLYSSVSRPLHKTPVVFRWTVESQLTVNQFFVCLVVSFIIIFIFLPEDDYSGVDFISAIIDIVHFVNDI